MYRLIALLLALIICVHPCYAKMVKVEVFEPDGMGGFVDPDRRLDPVLKPYYTNFRLRVERHWEYLDPKIGRTIKVGVIMYRDGREPSPAFVDIGRVPDQLDHLAISFGLKSLERAVLEHPQLPDCQHNHMVMVVTLKSRTQREPVDTSGLCDALLAIAGTAAIGAAIWALIKYGGSSSGGGYVNPQYQNVSGYWTRFGTYVQPYRRTVGNSTILDNYGTKGNINPWTGQPGTVVP